MSDAPATSLAVIAVTHDSAHVLPDWIKALEQLGSREQLELCVVDSGSSPKQLATMREQASGRVDVFVSLPNVGYGAACNAGAAATRGHTLFFTNPDVQVRSLPPRALNSTGLGSVLVGGFATDPERTLGFARLPTFREEAEELVMGPWSRAYGRSTEPAWVSGAALMLDREAFERIDGFSPAFFMYFEDADLCARHCLAGGSLELDTDLLITHGSGRSTEESQRGRLGPSLESVNRLSGRKFAARYGRPWHGAALYLLLVFAYAPRRMLIDLVNRRLSLGEALSYISYLLLPRRALHKLGAQKPDATAMDQ